MEILKANEGDLQEILGLQYLAYQSEAELHGRYDIQPLHQTIEEVREEYRRGTVLKATDENGRIVGSIRGRVEDGTLLVAKVMVHPDHRGKGLGKRLLAAIEEVLPHTRCELFTSALSSQNIGLYEKMGYRIFKESEDDTGFRFVYMEK